MKRRVSKQEILETCYYIETMAKSIRRWLEHGSVIAMCGRQNNGTLKDIHVLTPITYKYGTLHAKLDSVDITEVMDLKMESIWDFEEGTV